jgi:hypothetical protein
VGSGTPKNHQHNTQEQMSTARSAQVMTEEQMDKMDDPFGMPPPPSRLEIGREAMDLLDKSPIVCSVCDMFLRIMDKPKFKKLDELPKSFWSTLQCPPSSPGYGHLDPILRRQYNIQEYFDDVVSEELHDKIGNVLLSDNGIIFPEEVKDGQKEAPKLVVCEQCLRSLKKSTANDSDIPPKNSIANGNASGWVDDWVWGPDMGIT